MILIIPGCFYKRALCIQAPLQSVGKGAKCTSAALTKGNYGHYEGRVPTSVFQS